MPWPEIVLAVVFAVAICAVFFAGGVMHGRDRERREMEQECQREQGTTL